MRIVIMRHGRPALDFDRQRFALVVPSDFTPALAQYEITDLADDSAPPAAAVEIAKSCNVHFTSSLQRAIASTQRLNLCAEPNRLFVESPIPHTDWRWPGLPTLAWAVLFRLAWLAGFSANGEAIASARQRAAQGVDLLAAEAAKADVFLLAHGVINRLLAAELKKRGWQKRHSKGDGYWSFPVFEK